CCPLPNQLLPHARETFRLQGIRTGGISAGLACSVVLVAILSVFLFVRLRLRRRVKVAKNGPSPKKIGRVHCVIFDLLTLQEATEHFSENNKIGEGGFGTVYKGILPDGQEIAVKTLVEGTSERGLHQLHNEVLILAELQHKNLVRLQGFCSHQNDTLLVYEYIKNGSLDNFLFVLTNQTVPPFHPTPILRRGYMSPEYAMDGSLSPKVDIFSFGVLALEIVTRRSNCSFHDHGPVNLLTNVWGHWIKGTIWQMLHQSLDGYARSQALRCIHVGLLCVQQDPEHRPEISTVVFMLTRDSMELQPPSQPAFFFGGESTTASVSNRQNTCLYDRIDFVLQQSGCKRNYTY
ncbi:hypothetical protein U9M48_015493, partial [Paspalum notatum var. saurae]